jgi:hypothetical protein
MYRLVIILLLFISHSIFAQVDSIAVYYAESIDQNSQKTIVYTLADDSLLGRETATKGQVLAQNYLINEFKNLEIGGADNGSYLQQFNVITNNFNTIKFEVKNTIFENNDALFTISNIEDIKLIPESLVFIGYGIDSPTYTSYESISVNNKVAFIIDGIPVNDNGDTLLTGEELIKWSYNDDLKADIAFGKGALAVIFVKKDYNNFLNKKIRYFDHRNISLISGSDMSKWKRTEIFMDESTFYTVFNIDKKGVEKVISKKNSDKKFKVLEIKNSGSISIKSNREIKQSSNVIGQLLCNDSLAPWIVLSAHYDHIGVKNSEVFNGADDNASGVSAIIEIAKAFKQAKDEGVLFKKNILFLLVSGEEKGLLGSKYYSNHPIKDLNNTIVNLNIDMIGRVDEKHIKNENYIYVIGADKISKKLHRINEEVNELYTKLKFDYTYNLDSDPNRFYYRSDHYSFAKKGIPIIFYFNGIHEDYHKESDSAEKINYPLLMKRTKLVFYTAWYLATMDGLLLP